MGKRSKKKAEAENPLDAITRMSKEFDTWFNKLSVHDQMNFKVLINLPNADKLLTDMPEGEYKNQALFARAIVKGLKDAAS